MSDYEFVMKFRELTRHCDMPTIADYLHIGQPTFMRWLSGINLPYKMMRVPIIRALEKYNEGRSKVS